MYRVLILSVLALSGCGLLGLQPAETPQERLHAARLVYIAVVDSIADARDAGLLDDESLAEVKLIAGSALRALNLWEMALDLGDAEAAAKAESDAIDALARLQGAVNGD